jgi:hypothetical protein
VGARPDERSRAPREQRPDRVERAQPVADRALAAGELDHAVRQERCGHLDRVVVAVRVHQQLVGVDGARELLARPAGDARDVAPGRRVDQLGSGLRTAAALAGGG